MKTYASDGQTVLIDDNAELNRGGEGRIMLLSKPAGKVAKLYFDHICPPTEAHIKALQVLDSRYFIKPEQLLYADTNQQKVVGFIMPLLDNSQYYPLSALFSLPFCQKNGITSPQKITIAHQITDAILDAHQKGIVIGDLSGLNILIDSNSGNPRFIDVDSYQSPAHPHSGILLDEIRDYYYGGNVSIQSDLFALSVILFQLFTYAHPFKGIHKTYTTLPERMIHRIPVFAADKQLTVPKCYMPLGDAFLQQQFESVFMYGQRTPIQFNANTAGLLANNNTQKLQLPPISQLTAGAMQITNIWQADGHEQFLDAYTGGQYLVIKTNLQYRLYDLSIAGRARLTAAMPANDYSHLWPGNQYTLALGNGQLYGFFHKDMATARPLQNLHLNNNSRIVQYGNILAVVEPDFLKTVYIDEQNAHFIRFEQQPVFGAGLHVGSNGLKQHIGSQTYLWFRTANVLAAALSPTTLQDVFVVENQALITHIDSSATTGTGNEKRLKHTYVNIQNLHLQSSRQDIAQPKHFAYRALNKQHGLVFEPCDDGLLVRRTEDYQILQTIDCTVITDQTRLFNSTAGIIAACDDAVWLLNKNA